LQAEALPTPLPAPLPSPSSLADLPSAPKTVKKQERAALLAAT